MTSSYGFNGWKRDTRHARRRANLATSSEPIPTDSQAAAPRCHRSVIALSTAVARFGAISTENLAGARLSAGVARRERALLQAATTGLTRRQYRPRIHPAPEQARL
jgi:hypothetical protein